MKMMLISLALMSFAAVPAQAQPAQVQTIEGYWQDIAGRTTFARNVSPTAVYGTWIDRELDATYPKAKQIGKSAAGFDLVDLNFTEKDYSIRILLSDASRIVFHRIANWSACRMEHDCRLDGKDLFCSNQSVCQEAGKEIVDWRGEERYMRRERCERDGGVQAQGFPVKCR